MMDTFYRLSRRLKRAPMNEPVCLQVVHSFAQNFSISRLYSSSVPSRYPCAFES